MGRFRYPLTSLVVLVVAMLACGVSPGQEAAVQEVQATLRPTFTPTSPTPTDTAVPPTDTPLPTDTPSPPTDTPLPTDTPIPATATPETLAATAAPTRKPATPTKTPLPPTATPNPVLLEARFESGVGSGWKVFENYWRVDDSQWYWQGDIGVGGSGGLAHNCCASGDEAEDALMMYLGEGAEEWTDYRVETQFMMPTDKKQWVGLWFRGQFEERTKKNTAQWVTGYYLMLGRQRVVKLLQLQTADDCQGDACGNAKNLYAFNNPYILREERIETIELTRGAWHTLAIEVQGNKISIWVDGVFCYDYVDDKVPFLTGTVGFKTFEAEPAYYDNLAVKALE